MTNEFDRKKHIQKHKDKRNKIKSDIKSGKMKSGKRKSTVDEDTQDPQIIRNQLAEEYNRLIREGDPETKELREQIYDQIQKFENAIESNN